MSQENVRVVEEVVAAWNRRDLESILSLADAEAVYVNSPVAVETGTRHGHDGLAAVFEKQWESLGVDAQQQIDQAHPRGDEVITVGRMSRRMPGGTGRLENRIAVRWVFREQLLIRLEVLGAGSTFKDALKAARLSE